jgi:hypothetical protein
VGNEENISFFPLPYSLFPIPSCFFLIPHPILIADFPDNLRSSLSFEPEFEQQ